MTRDEAEALENHIKGSDKKDDAGFNSFFRRGWKRFYLKWYGDNHASAAELCPKATALLAGIPSIKAAMFAELPAGSKLVRHRDPYAGAIRRSEEHTSELQSRFDLVCRLLLVRKKV